MMRREINERRIEDGELPLLSEPETEPDTETERWYEQLLGYAFPDIS